MSSEPEPALALAERIALAARSIGIETALIGAAALAVHRYTRGTQDIDLAVNVDARDQLTQLARALEREGISTELRMPDENDVLGVDLVAWCLHDTHGEPIDRVEVVNFFNHFRPTINPGAAALRRAVLLPGSPLRCVAIEDLVALKLYAGGRRDHADIVEVLRCNPDVDEDKLISIAGSYGAELLRQLIAESRHER
jgi:hypothetical protein